MPNFQQFLLKNAASFTKNGFYQKRGYLTMRNNTGTMYNFLDIAFAIKKVQFLWCSFQTHFGIGTDVSKTWFLD